MHEALSELAGQLRRSRGARSYSSVYPPHLQVYSECESAAPDYSWDGMRRGADPAHPFFVFQYTLEGLGSYEDRSGRYTLHPGMAFTAIIPSEHRYHLPAASSGWKYLWLIILHPYVVQRVAALVREAGAVQTIAPTHPLILRTLELHESYHQRTPHDPVTREQMVFAFLWEYERLCLQRQANSERERLLGEVRQYLLTTLDQAVGVAELARWRGMSRSNFSHQFKALAGLAPAAFIQQVRLDEATRRLLQTSESIAQIARETGFASANHFCKVFRQRFHLSPGAFRKQMG